MLNDGSTACWMYGIFYLLQLHLIQVPIQGLYSFSPYSCDLTFYPFIVNQRGMLLFHH